MRKRTALLFGKTVLSGIPYKIGSGRGFVHEGSPVLFNMLAFMIAHLPAKCKGEFAGREKVSCRFVCAIMAPPAEEAGTGKGGERDDPSAALHCFGSAQGLRDP